jgi:putative iron-regulated protein
MSRKTAGLAAAAILAAAAAWTAAGPPRRWDSALARPVILRYADHLHAAYADATDRAAALREEIRAFLRRPSPEGLESCKAAWVRARPAYLETEIARFSGGPIDRSPDGPETFINAWPVDESYIDSVDGRPFSGIINDPAGFPSIDEAALRRAHGAGGETHVTTGWHAIEFLLWGQDRSPGPGGGARPFTDFADRGTLPNAPRRRAYLELCADLLVRDLSWVRDQWAPARPGNYRETFLALAVEEALSRILTGVGTMAVGELRGERLAAPFTLKDKEEEHSCFSDTTHLDHLHNALGVRRVWEIGVGDLARRIDSRLAADVARALEDAIEALRSPDLEPFDQAILGDDDRPGRRAILRALGALDRFNRAFSRLADRLGLPVTTRLP